MMISIWLGVISLPPVAAQTHHFRDYDARDGMPISRIQHLIQDGLGFIWINHESHLSRFDGYNFKTYMYVPGDSMLDFRQSLYGSLTADRLGDIWINNYNSFYLDPFLARYDRGSDGFVFYYPKVSQGTVASFERDITKPILWLAGRKDGLFEFNFETNSTRQFRNQLPDSIENVLANWVFNISDHGRYLLIGTRLGVWKFVKQTGEFLRPEFPNEESRKLFSSGGLNVPGYHNNWKWLHHFSGVDYKVDSTLTIIKHLDRIPNELLMIGADWAIDSKDQRWVSNENGLFLIEQNGQEPKKIWDDRKDTFTHWITIDRDENIWLAGQGLRQYLPHYNFSSRPQILTSNTYSTMGQVLAVKDNPLYDFVLFGSDGPWDYNIAFGKQEDHALRLTDLSGKDKSKTRGNFIQAVRGSDHIWGATWDAGVFGIPYTALTKKPSYNSIVRLLHDPGNPYTINSNQVWAVYEDNLNQLWVGTFSGMAKVDLNLQYGMEGSVIRYLHDAKDTTSLGHQTVRHIIGNGTDTLFVATESGVDLFTKGKFYHIFKDSYRVTTILRTQKGNLMVFTDGGVFECDKTFRNSKRILPYVPEAQTAAIETPDQRIWMVTELGLVVYDPASGTSTLKRVGSKEPISSVDLFNDSTLAVTNFANSVDLVRTTVGLDNRPVFPQLVAIKVNNEEPDAGVHPGSAGFRLPSSITVLNKLELDYLHNNFSIEFSAMDFTEPSQNMYKHMLENFDRDWILTDAKNRIATYTNLPAGSYVFRVRASNYDGVWSDNERTLKVIILPPPWRTWWAYAGYWALGIGLLVLARRSIVQRERLKASLQLEHVELEKAKEVDKVKTSFFTNISHEFRTPLTLIKGPVQGMIDQFVNGQTELDKQKIVEQLRLVQRNSDLLLKLINQLLDLAKLESGSLKVEKSEADVYSFVRAIASSFESFARQKNVSLQVNVPVGNCNALFDKDKVETILINLINNAIKFTPSDGSVTVIADLSCDPDKLRLSVKDTGIGIPVDQQQKIFERFHQVSEAHKEVGTGVGLSLVKELVALMGGTISVTSEEGKGSEFIVTLPVEKLEEVSIAETVSLSLSKINTPQSSGFESLSPTPHSQSITELDSTRPHVLVVEDNDDLRAFIIDSLGDEFTYLEADNGRKGLEKATTEIPDLIISDVMMPEMDGMEMAEKIKKDMRTSHIPLIMLTAKSTEANKLEGLERGADDYLTKPFNRQELLLKVRNGVNRQQKLREKLRAELLSEAPKVEVMSEDEKFLNTVKEKILERLSDEQLSVESLAEDIGLSRVQLYRKVSGLAGIAVNELIRKLRMQRAAQLLAQNWGPVSQVAYEVGFSNLSYFSKVFKEEFGVLPSEYGKT